MNLKQKTKRYFNFRKHFSNWKEYRKFQKQNPIVDHFVFKLRSGIAIDVPPSGIYTFKEVFFDEVYLEGLPGTIFPQTPLVLDVGANIGYFSMLIFALYPGAKVIGYEPMPQNYKMLEKHRQIYSQFDWTIENRAVSYKEGELSLYFNAEDEYTMDASIHDSDRNRNKIEVSCTTLEKIFAKNSLAEIDCLKLDCEGSEYDILYELPFNIMRRTRSIVIEAHQGLKKEDNIFSLYEYIKQRGFHVKTDKKTLIWAWQD